MRVLVTGAAGFIGSAVCLALLARGDSVTGIDNLNDYYDPALKKARLARIKRAAGEFRFSATDVADRFAMAELFDRAEFDMIVHLAAQAGVRYSIERPEAYIDSNLVGFANVLEGAASTKVRRLVYASSSSVYGDDTEAPFHETARADRPRSLYAATKRANELMAHAYGHLYRLQTVGLRFFTVYGPWGRPDMAPIRFARAIMADQPLQLYGHGQQSRDFTYIDDVVESVLRILDHPLPASIYNLGSSHPASLMDFITGLENALGREARKELRPMQPGDVRDTHSDTTRLHADTGYQPDTPLREGLARFAEWFLDYYS